jgi:hypothetical protein
MTALASPEQLGTYLNASIAEDDARAELILTLVSAAVVQEVGSAADEWTAENVPDVVVGVILSAASRRWENPSGASGANTGPFSKQWGSADLLTDDERMVLGRFRPPGVGGIYTIATTRDDGGPYDVPDTRFLQVSGQDDMIAHVPRGNYSW